MPTPLFTPGDEKQDERLNPGQQDADRRFGDLSNAEKQGTVNNDNSGGGFGSNGDSSQDNNSAKDIQNRESTGSANSGWANNVNNSGKTKQKLTLKNFVKKKGPLLGIGGGLGIVGIIFAGLFSGAALPISLMQNITDRNDSSSTSMSRRALKTLQNAMTAQPVECSGVKIRCNMGRISNSALNSLERKGLTAVYNDSSPVTNTGKRTGYPSRNPDAYEIDVKGSKVTVPAGELRVFLADNPSVAAKVLGSGGAFNLRLKAWSGNHISQRLNRVFGLEKNGGLADGENKKTQGENFKENTAARLESRVPGASELGNVSSTVKAKVEPHLNKAKKGGVGYTLAVASCIGIKAPAYIAGGVAAVQLAQLLPIVNDVILSPGSKIKAGKASAEDAEAIGTLLTSQSPRESDGAMTSALDSKYLQSAMGVNTNKNAVSSDFTPGYSFLMSPVVIASLQASKQTQSACNAIMSPSAMYTALAVDSAVTVAASTTIIGGVVKVIASFAITEIAINVTKDLVADKAQDLLVDMAQNDKIPTAQGEELGDVLGVSAAAYFSAGGMARSLPTLKTSQLPEYAALQKEDEAFQREMDIASLSPFDTSSKYTFLGSIVNDATLAVALNSSSVSGPLGFLSSIAKIPSSLLSNDVHAAADSMENYCGYADSFGLALEGDRAGDTPAINMAGLPCTGITDSQANMSTEEAISLIADEGWLDEGKSFADNATIDDLLTAGYIKADTPLSDFIQSCSRAETGDYLFNSASCTVSSQTGNTKDITTQIGSTCVDSPVTNNDGSSSTQRVCASESADFAGNDGGSGVKNSRSLEAMSVFLLDFQIIQSINGEDEEREAGTPTTAPAEGISTGRPENTTDTGQGWSLTNNVDYSAAACAPGTEDAGTYTHPVAGFTFRKCNYQGKPVNSLVSSEVVSMVEAAKAEGTTLTLGNSFRSYEEQKSVYDRNCSGNVCNPPTAKPGNSQHERGLAIDFTACSSRSTACYQWLSKNAATYGYYNLPSEPWHWSMSGY